MNTLSSLFNFIGTSQKVREIPYTFTKTSGNCNLDTENTKFYKSGATVTARIRFTGTGQSTAAGSDFLVGNLSGDGLLPVNNAYVVGYAASSIFVASITPSGELKVRNVINAYTVGSTAGVSIGGSYLVEDLTE